MAKKIGQKAGFLNIIFLIFLLILPFGEIFRYEFGNGAAITINDIAVSILVLLWIFISAKKSFKNFLIKPLLLFLSFGIFSLIINFKFLNSSELIISSLYLIRWGVYAALFFIVSGFNGTFKRKIPIFMILSGFAVTLIGFGQFFFYPDLRNLTYLGWDEHLYRMFTNFLDPNFAGIFFVLNLLLMLGIFLNRFPIRSGMTMKVILAILGVVNLVAVFLTYSRSAFIMLFCGLATFLILQRKWKMMVGSIIILIAFTFIISLTNRSEGTNIWRATSSLARIKTSENALFIFSKNPVFGVGFNAYRYAQQRYGLDKSIDWQKSHAGAGTDNSFLFVLATTGIFGFFSYLLLWGVIFKKLFNSYKSTSDQFIKVISLVAISSVIGIFASSLFINSLFYTFIMEWLWILLGLCFPAENLKIKENT